MVEDPELLSALMTTFFQLAPKMARYYQVKLNDQVPHPEDLAALTKTLVGVILTTGEDAGML
ncbi:MAG: hypothetical protein MUO62_00665 [Anaerolineales bacterium]|nr:hypothetical protein [Anaerolineales bacterium]